MKSLLFTVLCLLFASLASGMIEALYQYSDISCTSEIAAVYISLNSSLVCAPPHISHHHIILPSPPLSSPLPPLFSLSFHSHVMALSSAWGNHPPTTARKLQLVSNACQVFPLNPPTPFVWDYTSMRTVISVCTSSLLLLLLHLHLLRLRLLHLNLHLHLLLFPLSSPSLIPIQV